MTGRSDIVDIACEIRAQTDKAIQVFDGDRTIWLPLSQIEIGNDGLIAMPEWLAQKKGLDMTERAMKVRDVAREYGVAPHTVYRWLTEGDLPSLRLPGGDHRFRREHLEEFEARCRERSSLIHTILSAREGRSGSSTGRSPVALDPFQRGKLSMRRLKDGATNG